MKNKRAILKSWRIRNPLKYAFQTLKDNAKRRGKEFGLTFTEFCMFCQANNYMELKGTTRLSLTIDRIDPERGYFFDNIRAISLSLNVSRRFQHCPVNNEGSSFLNYYEGQD